MYRSAYLSLLALFISSICFAQIVPYYGKNDIRYDNFDWKTYKTAHFTIYFYPKEEKYLQRVASMAESAYTRISKDLQHDVESSIPLIFFLTQSEFEQVNYLRIVEGILGATEPLYNRMAFAIDQPPDKLDDLITHELTHVFEFSMLFGGLGAQIIKREPPLWVMEGFAEFETKRWDPGDLMVVRDAVLTEHLPLVTIGEGLVAPEEVAVSRAPYNVGHAVFDFIHAQFGMDGVRRFWFELKKAGIIGSRDVFQSAFQLSQEKFNRQFAEFLRRRFSPFFGKHSPNQYGKEIVLPDSYEQIFGHALIPDSSEFSVLTYNKNDLEMDILRISATGKVEQNLTSGYTTDYRYLTVDSFYFEGRSLSPTARSGLLAYFARTGKRRSLFIIDPASGKRIHEISPHDIDQAASPSISPDGNTVLFTGMKQGQPDIFAIDLRNGKMRNITQDALYENTPVWSADGKSIFYTARIGSYNQILQRDVANLSVVRQITFADYDSTSPFEDPRTGNLFYSAGRNGVYNIYSIDSQSRTRMQYTDVIGGAFSPIVFYENGTRKLAFRSFFKGKYRLFVSDSPVVLTTLEPEAGRNTEMSGESTAGSGAAGTVMNDIPQININQGKIQDKGLKLVLSGAPNVVTGYSGDAFAIGSGVVFEDILGDQQFSLFTSRIRGFQSYNFGYLNLAHRFQFLTQAFFQDDFFFAQIPPQIARLTGFSVDILRNRTYGTTFISQYPLSYYYRLEFGAGIMKVDQRFLDDQANNIYRDFLQRTGSRDFLSNGGYLPLSIALVAETTRFREFGPIAGYTFRISVDYAPPVSSDWVSRAIYQADLRKYFRLSARSLLAARARGFTTSGRDPVIFSFGGGQDVRGFDFREVAGNEGAIGNLEFRFPLAPQTTNAFFNGLRGKIFTDYFRIRYKNQFNRLLNENTQPHSFAIRKVNGRFFVLDLTEGAGSIGAGFSVFLGSFPFNFDFAKVYGAGQFLGGDGFLNENEPKQKKFIDGIDFQFSIGFDF